MRLWKCAGPRAPSFEAEQGWGAIGLNTLSIVLLVAVQAVVVLTTLQYLHQAGTSSVGDFDAFYLAGRMMLLGRGADAYDAHSFFDAQFDQWSTLEGFLWSYPPQFNFVAAALALPPPWIAYLIFIEATLVAYLLSLRAISGSYLPYMVVITFPFLVLNARTGQNGFLTGALLGWFFKSFKESGGPSGIPLGLMVIKPHLAVGIAVFSLISRRWMIIAMATLVVIITSLVSTVVFGSEIWVAFLHGAKTTGAYLAENSFKFFRMTSLYATLRSLGLPAGTALLAHFGVAIAVMSVVVGTWVVGWRVERVLGLLGVASTLISPYNNDYDLAIYGLALGLMFHDISRVASQLEITLLIFLSWFSMGSGLYLQIFPWFKSVDGEIISAGGISLIVVFIFAFSAMLRAERIHKPDMATFPA